MKNAFTALFILTTLFLSLFFSYEVVYKHFGIGDIFRLIGAVFSPVPVALFLAFLFPQGFSPDRQEVPEDVRPVMPVICFSGTTLFLLGSIVIYEKLSGRQFSATIFPVFINSYIICLYALNFYRFRSVVFAGILSGVSMGTVLYIVFFYN